MKTEASNGNPTKVMAKVLIGCDDVEVGRIWADGLRQRNYDVIRVENVRDVVSRWERRSRI